jgi:hypothetical protein
MPCHKYNYCILGVFNKNTSNPFRRFIRGSGLLFLRLWTRVTQNSRMAGINGNGAACIQKNSSSST